VVGATAIVSGHSATYSGQVRRAFHFSKPAIVFGPVVSSTGTTLDWRKAFHSCFGTVTGCVTTGDATVALATATGPGGFPSASGDLFDHSVVFVITWSPGPCITIAEPKCRVVDIVPTSTYRLTYAFEIDSRLNPFVGYYLN